ncbi:hypothetical protein GCM10009839_79140 [Catenulispora yoronensis]|uniref:DUF4304 domain-containing protein n=1 Tax=Catenulispora yoronensis TaxID=450799 RepID=A0ABN2VB02_9ACTN
MTTAQDLFRTLIHHNLAPRLRALGWQGSGQRYLLPDPRSWAQMGFQRSRSNTAASVRFTVNISVIGKAAWAEFRSEQPDMPLRPRPGAHYWPSSFHCKRIGDLMPADEDIWWELAAGHSTEDVSRVADGVYAAIAEYAMPAVQRMLAQAGVAVVTGPDAGPVTGPGQP